MRKLLIYLSENKKECILAPLFKMLEAIFELCIPLIMAKIIDVGIKNRDVSYLLSMCLVMIALGIVGLVCSVTAQYYSAKAAVDFGSKLRYGLFSHLQHFSFAQQEKIGASTLITRMTIDINQVQAGVNIVLRLFLRSPFIVFGAMIMAFTINTSLALIFAVTILLLSIVVFGILLISIPLYKKVQHKLDQLVLSARENLTGVRVLRAFHMEKREAEKFKEINQGLTKEQLYVGRISALLNPMTYVMLNIATLYLIAQGAWSVDTGTISQGELVALINYMSQILVELIKLALLIVSITKSFACADRIANVLAMNSDLQNRDSEEEDEQKNAPLILVQEVSFAYEGAREESLSEISFEGKKGEIIGILGGTGSGKSTLLQLLPGFYQPQKGKVFLNGREVTYLSKKERLKPFGMVLQKDVLFQGTLEDNLKWGNKEATKHEIDEALKDACAYGFVMEKKEGLKERVKQGGNNFSGGQRQRLSIARALVKNPDILILDDSFSALDYVTDAKLKQSLKEKGKQRLTIIASQRVSTVMEADKIIVLEEGKIAGTGTHADLMKHSKVYQEIFYSQFPKEEGKNP